VPREVSNFTDSYHIRLNQYSCNFIEVKHSERMATQISDSISSEFPILEILPGENRTSQAAKDCCSEQTKALESRIIVLIIDCSVEDRQHIDAAAFVQTFQNTFDIRVTCFHGKLPVDEIKRGRYCAQPGETRKVVPITNWMCCRRFDPWMYHIIAPGDIKVDTKVIKNVQRLIVWSRQDTKLFIKRWWWWDTTRMVSHDSKYIRFWDPEEFESPAPELRRRLIDSLMVTLRGFIFG